jgi:putative transposase
MCRVLDVSTSGYYSWCKRELSAHDTTDQKLLRMIRTAHQSSRGTYGAPRIHVELVERGVSVSRKRVARLMHHAEIRGVSRRRWVVTTKRSADRRAEPDLVDRDFSADGPDQLWVADITYVPTWAGFLYLAVVLDVWSRKIVGWALHNSLREALVHDALELAIVNRQPRAVVHHSDQGSQYTSVTFGQHCREAGVRPSMGSVGDCYDNAMVESFFATLECEVLDRTTLRTHQYARTAVFEFIEGWYNPHRRHSGLGYLSPTEFERRHRDPAQAPRDTTPDPKPSALTRSPDHEVTPV